MIHVATELFGGKLPVAWDHPLLDAGNRFRPRLGAIQHMIHVKPGIAEIGIQVRSISIPICKDQTFVGFDPGL